MAAAKSNPILWVLLGVGIVGFIAIKVLPGLTQGFAGAMAGTSGKVGYGQATGGLPFAYNAKVGNGTFSTSGDATSLISKLLTSLKATTGKPPSAPLPVSTPGSGGGGGAFGSNMPFQGLLPRSGSESVSQVLANGDYSGFDQNTLAGIYNIQQGGGDFAGDSRSEMAQQWADTGQLGSSPTFDGYQFADPGYTPQVFTDFVEQSIPGNSSDLATLQSDYIDTSPNYFGDMGATGYYFGGQDFPT